MPIVGFVGFVVSFVSLEMLERVWNNSGKL